jgi:hypothetical protein
MPSSIPTRVRSWDWVYELEGIRVSDIRVSERTSFGNRANRGVAYAALHAVALVVFALGISNAGIAVAQTASEGRGRVETAARAVKPAQPQVAAARVDGPKAPAPSSVDARPRFAKRLSGAEPLWLLLLGSTLFAVASCINVFVSRRRAE